MGLKFDRESAIRDVIKNYSDDGAIVNRAFAEFVVDAIAEGVPSNDGCPHDLKEYKGIVQNYVYCTICDEKFP